MSQAHVFDAATGTCYRCGKPRSAVESVPCSILPTKEDAQAAYEEALVARVQAMTVPPSSSDDEP